MKRKQMLSSGIWVLAGNALQQVLQLTAFLLLARILDPSAFGYVALANVVLETAAALGGWGLIQIGQQRKGFLSQRFVSHIQISALIIATMLVFAIGGGLAIYTLFYGFTLTVKLILALLPTILFQALTIAPETILLHRMQFKWLAVRNNAAVVVGSLFALLFAFAGFQVYALVVQRMAAVLTLMVFVWVTVGSSVRFLPVRQYRLKLIQRVLIQGAVVVCVPLSSVVSSRLSDFTIGLFLGPSILGEYKIAVRIIELVGQITLAPMRSVAIAAFPKLANQPDTLRSIYVEFVQVGCFVALPSFTFLGIISPVLISIVLGRNWGDVSSILRMFCLASLPMAIVGSQAALFQAFRKNAAVLTQNVLLSIYILIATAVSVRLGVVYVSLSIASGNVVSVLVYQILGKGLLPSFGRVLRNIIPSIAAVVIMAVQLVSGIQTSFYTATSGGVIFAAVNSAILYIFSLVIMSRGRVKPLMRFIPRRLQNTFR